MEIRGNIWVVIFALLLLNSTIILGVVSSEESMEEWKEIDSNDITGRTKYSFFPISNNAVISLTAKEANTIWAGTTNGAVKWDLGRNSYQLYLYNPMLTGEYLCRTEDATKQLSDKERDEAHVNLKKDILGCRVTEILCSNSGLTWLKTEIGLAKISEDGKNVKVYDSNKKAIEGEYDLLIKLKKKEGLIVYPIDDDQNIYLYYPGKCGILIYNGRCWKALSLKETDGIKFSNNNVKGIYQLGKIIYIVCDSCIYQKKGDAISIYRIEDITKKPFPMSQDSLFYMYRTLNGIDYVWTTQVMYMCNGTKWKKGPSVSLGYDFIEIAESRKGDIWVGSLYDNTVYHFDGTLFKSYGKKDGLLTDKQGAIWDIFISNSGEIWIATGKGVNRLKEGAWLSYDERNGLSSNVATRITSTIDNKICIGTVDGLNIFDGTAFKTYRTRERVTLLNEN